MREAIVILAVIAILLILTAIRYRRQIAAAMHIWRMFRSLTNASRKGPAEIDGKDAAHQGPLVSCARCGTWVPQERAIKLGKNTFYCSSECVEQYSRA